MINRVVLVGRLTKDPELKYTQGGVAVTRFTLAVNRTFTNQQGQREADFVNCVTWRKQAENTANYLRKGSLAGVEGRIQTSNFEGKDGNRVFMTEVVADSIQFLEPKSAREQNSYNQGYDGRQYDSGGDARNQQQNAPNPTQSSNYSDYGQTHNAPPMHQPDPLLNDDDLPF